MNYKKLLFIGLLLVAVSACDKSTTVATDEMAALHLANGLQLASKGEHDKAVAVFQQGLQLAPDNLGLLYNQAVAYSELSELGKEKVLYLHALQVVPSTKSERTDKFVVAIHYNLAIVLLSEAGESAAVYTHLDQALSGLDEVDDYYHLMDGDADLAEIRESPRFIMLMRKYWPGYQKMVGVHPASSRELIRKKELELQRAYEKSIASP